MPEFNFPTKQIFQRNFLYNFSNKPEINFSDKLIFHRDFPTQQIFRQQFPANFPYMFFSLLQNSIDKRKERDLIPLYFIIGELQSRHNPRSLPADTNRSRRS
jgi:hypothetical protein